LGFRLQASVATTRVLLTLLVMAALASAAHAQSEEVEYYGTDALGSVRVVFDAAGNRLARTDYVPFGEALNPTGALPSEQFTGQPRDGDAGLDYFGARYYAARLGRFSTLDPVGGNAADPQSWNRYAYAHNNPGSFIDPNGMDDCQFTQTTADCTVTAPMPPGPPSTPTTPFYLGPPIMGCTFNPAQCGLYWDDDPGPLIWCAMYCGQGPDVATGQEDDALQVIEDIVDVINVVDPTPVTSIVSGAINAKQGDTTGVALAAAGAALPAADLAKGAKSAANLLGRIGAYGELRKLAQGAGLQVHHLLEKRFAPALDQRSRQMLAIVLTKEEHQAFTNAWRAAISYGVGTASATSQHVHDAAKQIYVNNPSILKALGH